MDLLLGLSSDNDLALSVEMDLSCSSGLSTPETGFCSDMDRLLPVNRFLNVLSRLRRWWRRPRERRRAGLRSKETC